MSSSSSSRTEQTDNGIVPVDDAVSLNNSDSANSRRSQHAMG